MIVGVRRIPGPVELADGTGRGSDTGAPPKFMDTVVGRGDKSCSRAVAV